MSKQKLSAGVKMQMIIWILFMPICLIIAVWVFMPDPNKDSDMNIYSSEEEAQAARTAPIGRLNLSAPQKETANTGDITVIASPKETYDSVCSACHSTGLLDAPKFGDDAAWNKRIADAGGFKAMVKIAINGVGSMPPKGGANLSDEEFAKVVSFISGQK